MSVGGKVTIEITEIFDVVEGETNAGDPWKKVQFFGNIISDDEYDRTIGFDFFGSGDKVEKIDKFIEYNSVGKEVEVSYNVSSRVYEGKVYHNIDAWKVYGKNTTSANAAPVGTEEDYDDDLPF